MKLTPRALASPNDEHIVMDMNGCARCHGSHKAVVFFRLTHPITSAPYLTHWAPCPTDGEPILLGLVDKETAEHDARGAA